MGPDFIKHEEKAITLFQQNQEVTQPCATSLDQQRFMTEHPALSAGAFGGIDAVQRLFQELTHVFSEPPAQKSTPLCCNTSMYSCCSQPKLESS